MILDVNTIARVAMLALLGLGSGCDDDPLVHQDGPGALVYEDMTKQWLRWAMAQPHSQSPIADETGERCAMGQNLGPGLNPWMLAGTFGGPVERECDVPANKPLFFPLINRWVIPGLDPEDLPDDVPGFIAWVSDYFAWARAGTCSLTLALDGEPLLDDLEEMDEELYVAVDEPFEVELDADNWATAYGKQGGVYTLSFADGHYALLEPLSPGEHTLELGGARCNDDGTVAFETHALYTLHVQGLALSDGGDLDED